MKCARGIALLSSLGFALALNAAEFEDGMVPIELVEEFVGGQVYPGLPEGFPVPDMPSNSGLRVLGSLNRGLLNQQVALFNSGTWEAARAMLRTAYLATGWLDVGPEDSPGSITGGSDQLSLCHDELGLLQFFPGSENRIRVNRTAAPPGAPNPWDCATIKEQASGPNILNLAMSLMPILELPDGAVGGAFPGVAFNRLSSTSIRSSGPNFRVDRDGGVVLPNSSVSALYEHFEPQLETQGWTLDAAALGTASASSIWFKTVPAPEGLGSAEELELTGIMNIFHAEGDLYELQFRLISHGDGELVPDVLGPPIHVPELGIRGIPPGTAHGFISGGPIIVQP